jgi:hypothetical protein
MTSEWLTEALRSSGALTAGEVRSFSLDDLGEGVGLLGSLTRVTLDLTDATDDAPTTLIAKFPAEAEANRGAADSLGFYATELNFYRHMADSVGIRTPKSYGAFSGDATDHFTLLLENVDHLRSIDQITGMSAVDAATALQTVARFHARWWEHPRIASDLGWIERLDSQRWVQGFDGLYRGSWPTFVQNVGDQIGIERAAMLSEFHDKQPGLMQRVARRPATLCHGDFRVDNFFFEDTAEQPLCVLDWQIMCVGIGPSDVAYLLGTSLAVDTRRAHEKELVELYHRTLVSHGVSDYSLDACWDDYRLAGAQRLPFTAVVVIGGLELGNERGEALGKVTLDRLIAFYDDHDFDSILAAY